MLRLNSLCDSMESCVALRPLLQRPGDDDFDDFIVRHASLTYQVSGIVVTAVDDEDSWH